MRNRGDAGGGERKRRSSFVTAKRRRKASDDNDDDDEDSGNEYRGLPSDFEDEEIDEDEAFNNEDWTRFAGVSFVSAGSSGSVLRSDVRKTEIFRISDAISERFEGQNVSE